jgi:hypothetical protein
MSNRILIQSAEVLDVSQRVLTEILDPAKIVLFAENLKQISGFEIDAFGFYLGFNIALLDVFKTDQLLINLVNEQLEAFLIEFKVPEEFKKEVLEAEKTYSSPEFKS